MKKLTLLIMVVVTSQAANAQTLYVDDGTAGIADSQNANVGVATDNPTENLHVAGTVGVGKMVDRADAGLRIEYVDGGSGTTTFRHGRWGGHVYFTRNSSLGDRTQFYFGGSQHHTMDIYDNNNNVAVRLTSGGKSFLNGGHFGIGTVDPQFKLDIKGRDLLLNNNSSSIHLRTDGNGNAFINNMNNFVGNGSTTNGYLALTGQSMLRFNVGNAGSSGSEKMRITDAGIGIGTTDPLATFQVANTTGFDLGDTPNGQDHILFSGPDPGTGGYFGGLTWQVGSRRRASIAATREHTDDDFVGLAFFTQGANGPGPVAESMRITHSGNVGIGTSAPDEKLTVKGKIHAEEVRIDLSVPGPDYVFEKDYPLPSLDEVAKYIDEHKHLPEVPSAGEMEEEGVNLGEMEMVLLRKIEELTLYVIEQNKLVAKLQAERNASSDAVEINELKEHLREQEKRIQTLEKENMLVRAEIEKLKK